MPLGILGTIMNNMYAEQRESAARAENYRYGELAAQNADIRTRKLYEDLESPKALLEQYRKAGLSPSLMFGGGGIGGQPTQGAEGTGANGISPTTFGIDFQSPLETAQTALTLAEAKKVKAETKTIDETREPTIQNLAADLEKKFAETKLIGLEQVYQEFENSCMMFELEYQASTTEERVNQFFKSGEMLVAQVKSAKAKAKVDEETVNDTIQYVKERTLNLAADTLLKNSQITLNETQRTNLIKQLDIASRELDLNKDKLDAQIQQWGKENGLKKEEIDTMFTGIVVNGVAQGMGNILNILKFAKKLGGR